MTQDERPCGRRTNSGGKIPFSRSLSHLTQLARYRACLIASTSDGALLPPARLVLPRALVSSVTEPKLIPRNLNSSFCFAFSSPSATFGETPSLFNLTCYFGVPRVIGNFHSPPLIHTSRMLLLCDVNVFCHCFSPFFVTFVPTLLDLDTSFVCFFISLFFYIYTICVLQCAAKSLFIIMG
jgi:hypothetical protein